MTMPTTITRRAIALLAGAVLLSAATALSAGRERLHMPKPPDSVRIVRKAGQWEFLRIPSPGNNYDELRYDVRIASEGGRVYLHCTLFNTPEVDDRITAPYVRLLDTNGVEFALLMLGTKTYWSQGGQTAEAIALPFLPRAYYIACGYVFYCDTSYEHMQGGPQETIVDAETGKIVHRGAMRNAHEYLAETDRPSSLMFLGDTMRVKVAEPPAAGTNKFNARLDYAFFDGRTGTKIVSGEDATDAVFFPKRRGNYVLSLSVKGPGGIHWRDLRPLVVLPKIEWTSDPAYFGRLAINDAIACGLSNDVHGVEDGRPVRSLGEKEDRLTDRVVGSSLTNFAGGMARIVSHDRGFFGYTIGVNLEQNMPYLLEIEYPEDTPRTFAFVVGGGTYSPGIHTGHTLGQPEPRYFAEQISFPLSLTMEKAQFIVWAGDEEVREGLFVGVADPGTLNAPFSRKPVLARIALYDFLSIACVRPRGALPENLRRRVWVESEECMPRDGVRFSPLINALFYGQNAVSPVLLSWNGHGDFNNTILFRSERYPQPVRMFLDGVEYETDRVENPTNRYDFWGEYLDWARQAGLAVCPRIEYGGSSLLPPDARAVRKDGSDYPGVLRRSTGAILADSVDATHPAARADAEAVIDECFRTLTDEQRSVLRELGFRRRAHFLSTSFSERAIAAFEAETGTAIPGGTIEDKRTALTGPQLDAYRLWYQRKTLALLAALNERYRGYTLAQTPAPLSYYHWTQPGMPYEGLYYVPEVEWQKTGRRLRRLPFEGLPLPKITCEDLVAAVPRWTDGDEGLIAAAVPSGIAPTLPVYGAVASVCQPYLELFSRNGTPAARITPPVFSVTQLYRKGRPPYYAGETMYHSREFSMLEPLLAFCAGNVVQISFDQSHPACFPFPVAARRFFANYLALPAVPMPLVPQVGEVPFIVRMAAVGGATYVAVANTGFMPVQSRILLPIARAEQIRPLTGADEPLPFFSSPSGISFDVALGPVELKSFIIK
ncbi:hypothetical protein GX586_07570 [bacterium]|nr:hypothetical protein [bacterium]